MMNHVLEGAHMPSGRVNAQALPLSILGAIQADRLATCADGLPNAQRAIAAADIKHARTLRIAAGYGIDVLRQSVYEQMFEAAEQYFR
jgi:hypothetical protein